MRGRGPRQRKGTTMDDQQRDYAEEADQRAQAHWDREYHWREAEQVLLDEGYERLPVLATLSAMADVQRITTEQTEQWMLSERDVAMARDILTRPFLQTIPRGYKVTATTNGSTLESFPITCEWFALCTREATTYLPHPVLGRVPACQRCADRAGK